MTALYVFCMVLLCFDLFWLRVCSWYMFDFHIAVPSLPWLLPWPLISWDLDEPQNRLGSSKISKKYKIMTVLTWVILSARAHTLEGRLIDWKTYRWKQWCSTHGRTNTSMTKFHMYRTWMPGNASLFLAFGSSFSVETPSASASHAWLSRTRKSFMPQIVCQCIPSTAKPLLSLLSFQAHFKASIGWQWRFMFTNNRNRNLIFFRLMPIHKKQLQ